VRTAVKGDKMGDVIAAILFAFRGVFTFKAMKIASITGVLVSIFWIAVGYFEWQHITAFSSPFLVVLPFSILRSNGAWMLSAFLWFEVVLVTFALILALFGNFASERFSKNMHNAFAVVTILVVAAFWSVVWFYKGSYIHEQLLHMLSWLPFETIDKGVSFIIGIYLVYTAVITTMIFMASLLNHSFIKKIQMQAYGEEEIVKSNEVKVIKYTLRDVAIFLAASIVAIPLLFVPFLNFFVQIALWTWLMKDTFVYDNLSLVVNKVDKEKLHSHKGAFWTISVFTSFFNLVPVLNFYGPFFGELAMYHYIRKQQQKERL
jgi:hypothetical protein